jgi:molybdopterin-guanine dinucleotide biosynthesis protein A
LWTAAILAGGRARRFGGRDKSGLILAGRTILERQLAELGPMAASVLLVTSSDLAAPLPGLTVVVDRLPGAGALGAIYTALVESFTAFTAVVAGDMPFVSGRFLAYLVETAGDVDVVLPRTPDGYQPLCAVYARHAAEAIRERIDAGALKIADLVGPLRVREVGPDLIAPYDPDGTLFLNVNTPADYARALAAAGHALPAPGRPVATD